MFRADVSQIVFSFIEDVAGYTGKKRDDKMTAAVRKKDDELTINLKSFIGVLMTDSGLSHAKQINYSFCMDK